MDIKVDPVGSADINRTATDLPAPLADTQLTLKARGLYGTILLLQQTGPVTFERLQSHCPDSRDGLRAAIRELENRRYLVRTPLRSDKGVIGGFAWTLNDTPQRGAA